ncbi:MAG: alpha/beta hydrolase [Ignisphaera sp.]
MKIIEDFASLDTGVKVFYRCILPESFKELAIVSHGFTSHSGFYIHIGKELASYGYGVCIHDQRGHGRTAQNLERGYVDSFNDFLVDLETFTMHVQRIFGGERTVLIGHSMGGLIVLLYAGKYGRVGDAVVAVAPAVLIPETRRFSTLIFATIASILFPRKRIELPFTEQQIEEGMKRMDRELLEAMGKDELVLRDTTIRLLVEIWKASREFWRYVERIQIPTLLIHGEKDNIIPIEASRRTYSRLKTLKKELIVYPECGHSPLHEIGWREHIKNMVEWIRNNI